LHELGNKKLKKKKQVYHHMEVSSRKVIHDKTMINNGIFRTQLIRIDEIKFVSAYISRVFEVLVKK
jgi:hypothetical protein